MVGAQVPMGFKLFLYPKFFSTRFILQKNYHISAFRYVISQETIQYLKTENTYDTCLTV